MPDSNQPTERTFTIMEAGEWWGVRSYNGAHKIVKRHGLQTFLDPDSGALCLSESEVQRAADARKKWKGPGRPPVVRKRRTSAVAA